MVATCGSKLQSFHHELNLHVTRPDKSVGNGFFCGPLQGLHAPPLRYQTINFFFSLFGQRHQFMLICCVMLAYKFKV